MNNMLSFIFMCMFAIAIVYITIKIIKWIFSKVKGYSSGQSSSSDSFWSDGWGDGGGGDGGGGGD